MLAACKQVRKLLPLLQGNPWHLDKKKRKPGQQQILGVWICLRGSSSKAITEKGAAWSNTCRVLFTAI
jgi:hypothetical protein